MMSRLFVTMKLGRGNFFWASVEILNMSGMGQRKLIQSFLCPIQLKFRNLEHELDGAKEALDEEAAGRDNILRLVAKAEGDAAAMRQKYEIEAVAKGEELEMTKMKLAARNTEAEATVDNLNAKLVQIEKAK